MKFKIGDYVVAKNYKNGMFRSEVLTVVDDRKRKKKGRYEIKVRSNVRNCEFWVPTDFLRKAKTCVMRHKI